MKANQHGYVLLVLCRVVLLLWVFGLLVFFASRYRSRFDLTAEKLYTLTPATKKVLVGLKDRLMIECYFSPDDKLPEHVREARRVLRNTLDEYVQLGGDKVKLEYLDPDSDVQLKEKAERLGIKPNAMTGGGLQSLKDSGAFRNCRRVFYRFDFGAVNSPKSFAPGSSGVKVVSS